MTGERALFSPETKRWFEQLPIEHAIEVAAPIEAAVGRDGAIGGSVMDLPGHHALRGVSLIVDDLPWTMTFYTASDTMIMLTVYRLRQKPNGEWIEPPDELMRAIAALQRARRAGDDPSNLSPPT